MATFSTEHNSLALRNISNQVILGNPDFFGNTTTISAPLPASSRTYTIPDAGGSGNFLLSAGSQTINGGQTFSQPISVTPTTNQVVLGTTNTTTLSAVAPSASRTYNIIDVAGNSEFVMGVRHGATFSTGATLITTQSGLYITIANTGIAYSIVLPAVSTGTYFCFYVGGTLNAAVTLSSPTANVFGSVVSSDGTSITGGAITTAHTNVILGTGATKGDKYEFYCDGVNYYLQGTTGLHTSVTFS